GAGRIQASLVRLHVLLPKLPLVNICQAEFPVPVRLVNALEKSPALLLLRKMKKNLDGPCPIAIEMALQVDDGAIPLLPDVLLVEQFRRKTLVAQELGMHTGHQHFLVIRTIEDTDPATLGELRGRTPEKIMLQ